jgi:ABC-type branched-subunit amino acid transport system substrate-binding protein
VLLGVLYDFPQGDGGATFEDALRLGLTESADRRDREVELVPRAAEGLPGGSEASLRATFRELDDAGVLAVIGPSISDNGYVIRDLALEAGIPCINYTGGELTRNEWMFHYQVGGLEEEPPVIAAHVADRGFKSVAVLHDHSQVGRRYAEFFAAAASRHDVDITGTASISALAEDLTPVIDRLRPAAPDAIVYLGLGVAARAVSVALEKLGWDAPVVANSALMFGYTRKDWRPGWEGWVYVDTISDDNQVRRALKEVAPRTAAGPVGVAAYDIGRLVGEALVRCDHLTRAGLRYALERVKQMPAASGLDGTTMGFGCYDHAALKGHYLVLRAWRDGRSTQV